MHVYRGINKDKNHAYDNGKQCVNKIVDEFFRVGPHLGEDAEGFSAALVFKFLVGECHGMLKPIRKNFCAKFLDHHIGKIILHVLGNPAHHGGTHRHQQKCQRSREKIIPAEIATVFLLDVDVLGELDDLSKDDRINQ